MNKHSRTHFGAPDSVKRDWNTVRLLSETLRRAKPEPLSESMRRQIAAIAKLALTERRRNRHVIQPRIKELAKASGIEVRMARKNLRALEAWGYIIPKAFKNGGLRQWRVDGDALFRALVHLRCNPSDELRRGLRLLDPVSPGESFDALRQIHTPVLHPGTDPGTRPRQTPALNQDLVLENQCLNQNMTVPDADFHHTSALTSALDKENAGRFHRVNDNQSSAESALPSNCEPSRARISTIQQPSLIRPVEPAGQMDEPLTGIPQPSPACLPLVQVPRGDLAGQNEAGHGDAFTVDCLTADAQDLLAHLELSGPSSYRAAASDLNWTPPRAWQPKSN